MQRPPTQANSGNMDASAESLGQYQYKRIGRKQKPQPSCKRQPPLRSRRYDLGFWGQVGGRRKRGRRAQAEKAASRTEKEEEDGDVLEQTRLDNQRDLERCRALLLEMTEEDLQGILMRSRFNLGGSATEHNAAIDAHKAVDDKWLDEAAAAYHVPITYIKVSAHGRVRNSFRRQADVVNDVIVAVGKARHCLRGAAADRDIRRKHELMRQTTGTFALQAYATIGVRCERCSNIVSVKVTGSLLLAL